jgi:hypothetical protein
MVPNNNRGMTYQKTNVKHLSKMVGCLVVGGGD